MLPAKKQIMKIVIYNCGLHAITIIFFSSSVVFPQQKKINDSGKHRNNQHCGFINRISGRQLFFDDTFDNWSGFISRHIIIKPEKSSNCFGKLCLINLFLRFHFS